MIFNKVDLSVISAIKYNIKLDKTWLCCVIFGLVTSLPRDRLSQVTRRGMLTYTKSNNKLHPTSQSEDRRVGYQRRMPLNKRPLGVTSVGRGIQREQTKREDGEEETLWEPTSELNRLLGQEDADIVRMPYFLMN